MRVLLAGVGASVEVTRTYLAGQVLAVFNLLPGRWLVPKTGDGVTSRPYARGWRRPTTATDQEPPRCSQSSELREAKRRTKTLEREVEVPRRAAAYFSQAHLLGK